MSGHIPTSLQRRVRLRAGDRCEYCRLAQAGQEATFHIHHVVPRAASGATVLENLALACVSCSLRKGARTTAIDPTTGEAMQLFHPRFHPWSEHFGASASGEIFGADRDRSRNGRRAVHEPGYSGRDPGQRAFLRAMAMILCEPGWSEPASHHART
jgi:HNH endonuclease